jgi:hypothetical protein
MTILTENYLDFLNRDQRALAKEWRGPNIPYGDDSNRPNLIRQCTMLESSKMKINCLRKLRDQAAMNPFYQYRIDRYIDEITDTYEPTEKPGTIPGNEFKETGVGEDTKIETVTESDDLRTWGVDEARAYCKKYASSWAKKNKIKDREAIKERYVGCLEWKMG